MILFAERNVSLKRFSTLRAGGRAEMFVCCRSVNDLADWAQEAYSLTAPSYILGVGSNTISSDDGVPGLVIVNAAREFQHLGDGLIRASSGLLFQDLFLNSARLGLGGLEYAVGIPGSVGGALVSNAGAYRSNISEFLTRIELVWDGERRWADPSELEFSYRDSVLRKHPEAKIVLLQVEMQLQKKPSKSIYDEAREYQRQRISKQPAPASCGSFFKNISDKELAKRIPDLRSDLKESGVIPAGVLMDQIGLKGTQHKGAMLSDRHANFMLNIGNATSTSIRSLAEYAKRLVQANFGVVLEEEVLYIGDWSRFLPEPVMQ